jgi:hypothetical protein
MITANFSIFGNSQITKPIQPEYQAVLDRATALGIALPELEQQRLDNNIVYYLKQLDLWKELDLLYIFKRSSSGESFSKLNWKNPNSFMLTSAAPPIFEPNAGWLSGTNTYFDTGYIPSVHAVKALVNDLCVFHKDSASGSVQSTFGCRNSSSNNFWASGTRTHLVSSSSGGGIVAGLKGTSFNVKNGTTHNNYVNGTLNATGTYVGATLPTVSLHLMALKNGATVQNFNTAGAVRLEFFGLGSKQLEAQQNNLYKILNHIYE